MFSGIGVYYFPSTNSFKRRIIPYNKMISILESVCLLKPELRETCFSRFKNFPIEQYKSAKYFSRSMVESQSSPVFQSSFFIFCKRKLYVEHHGVFHRID